MELKQDFIEFIELLAREKVRYLILGGYAVSFHTRPRATGDIDFFYAADRENCESLARVLEEFVGASEIRADDLMTRGKITMIGIPPSRIDLINSISGVEFEEAWPERVSGKFGPVDAYYISKADLLRNKRAANRSKDAVDIEWLEED